MDGIYIFTTFNYRGMADNTVNMMPGIKYVLSLFDWMIFDRTDESQKKKAV